MLERKIDINDKRFPFISFLIKSVKTREILRYNAVGCERERQLLLLTWWSSQTGLCWVQSTLAMATSSPLTFAASSSQVGARRLQWPHLRNSRRKKKTMKIQPVSKILDWLRASGGWEVVLLFCLFFFLSFVILCQTKRLWGHNLQCNFSHS